MVCDFGWTNIDFLEKPHRHNIKILLKEKKKPNLHSCTTGSSTLQPVEGLEGAIRPQVHQIDALNQRLCYELSPCTKLSALPFLFFQLCSSFSPITVGEIYEHV